MTPPELYQEATRRGLRLQPRGDKLEVIPSGRLTPDFADILRANKAALLRWLEDRNSGLTPDCVPWLHVAKQVLAGEFQGADDSTITSITIGLRGVQHPVCRQAMEALKKHA
jgi:hypothetical protein